MKKVLVKVEGISPLLMNRFRDSAIDSKSKKRTGAQAEPEITDKLYVYEGKICIPAVYFRNCMIEAGKQFKITGKGKSNYSKLIGSTVEVNPEMILLKPSDYETYSIAAVNPMTRGRMMTRRPRFNKWGAEFEIVLNDEGIPADVIKEILDHAGRYVGVGDWRPEKKGMFGKFMIVSWKESK
jgi:hypothetical protein